MSNLSALEQKLKEVLELADAIKKEIEVAKNTPTFGWEPEHCDHFFYVSANGSVGASDFDVYYQFDTDMAYIGNCFKTEQQAIDYADALKVIAELRRQPGRMKFVKGGYNWVVELYDVTKDGCPTEFKISTNHYSSCMTSFGQVFFDSQESAQNAIIMIGEDRIKNAILTMMQM